MTDNFSKDYIFYRLERAEETFQDALILARNNSWNSCINRLYYALFYAISALLLKNKIEATSHRGIKFQFNQNFIKPGIIKKEYGQLFTDLFDWRHKGDYGDFFDFDEKTVVSQIKPVEDLLIIIIDLINKD